MENGGENSALEGLLQVGNDVLGVLQTNGQAHGVGVNALIALLNVPSPVASVPCFDMSIGYLQLRK